MILDGTVLYHVGECMSYKDGGKSTCVHYVHVHGDGDQYWCLS